MTVDEARAALAEIERQLDAGSYRPGPWKALDEALRPAPAEIRRTLASEVSRVSEKLHRRKGRPTQSLARGLSFELGATALALLELRQALDLGWPVAVLAFAAVLTMTFQPLVKMTVGTLLGIRYAYFYMWGLEPRVKMQFGTFLAASAWRRIAVHLAGTIGSPLALALCSSASAPQHPRTALFLLVAFWFLVVLQLVMLLGGLAGSRRIPPMPPLALSSAGAAGLEIRSAMGRVS